jgi:hypothetical protein
MFSSIVMAVLFFIVVTPIGLIMRLVGRDPLRLRLERKASTYWVTRRSTQDDRQIFMTRQL